MSPEAVAAVSSSEVASPAPQSLLAVRGLSIEFRTHRGAVRVVEDVSLDLTRGATLGLVGESGSGKTVTSLAILGLLPASGRLVGGSISYDGRDLVSLSRKELQKVRGAEIGMIFQEPRRSLDPSFSVGDQIAESARIHLGLSRKEAWHRAIELLDLVGIPNASRRSREYPQTFSGGMCQRVMLATALAAKPKVLIADEPTTALDVSVQAQVLQRIADIQTEFRLTVMFITHDLGVIAEMCDEVAVMYAGQVIERSSTTRLFSQPRHPYSSGLLRSMPSASLEAGKLTAIPGTVPSPFSWPTGCRFAPRCEHATGACTAEPVPMRSLDSDADARCIRAEEITLRGAL